MFFSSEPFRFLKNIVLLSVIRKEKKVQVRFRDWLCLCYGKFRKLKVLNLAVSDSSVLNWPTATGSPPVPGERGGGRLVQPVGGQIHCTLCLLTESIYA